jgi:elongation factor P
MEISSVHKNSKIMLEGIPYNVDEAEFVKPGKGQAIYRLKLRNLKDDTILNKTYRSGEKLDEISVTTQKCSTFTGRRQLYLHEYRYL